MHGGGLVIENCLHVRPLVVVIESAALVPRAQLVHDLLLVPAVPKVPKVPKVQKADLSVLSNLPVVDLEDVVRETFMHAVCVSLHWGLELITM